MRLFIETYLAVHGEKPLSILDVGSFAVADHDSYRPLFERKLWTYTGVDIVPGPNVDIALSHPYKWDEISDDSADVVISGQALEHIAYFWVTAMEIGRALRPGGLACIIVPSRGVEHRYPLDCWRFYPDGMASIATWLAFELLDAHTDWHSPWGDSVLVMRKPIWGREDRARFNERLHHLRAALPDTATAPAASTLQEFGTPGDLSARLS